MSAIVVVYASTVQVYANSRDANHNCELIIRHLNVEYCTTEKIALNGQHYSATLDSYHQKRLRNYEMLKCIHIRVLESI